MPLLLRAPIFAHYSQVAIEDPAAREYPQWRTGEELVVALPQCIAVATQYDLLGDVTVEVWDGRLETNDPDVGEATFDGVLKATGETLLVGNVIANDLHAIAVKPGRYWVRVFTSPVGKRAERVYFVLNLFDGEQG